jgi:hypothetical protein
MTCKVSFTESGFDPLVLAADMWARYKPVGGDFLVVYADGYKSFSPRAAFIEGYARIDGHAADAADVDIDRVARVCHEANKAICEAFGDTSQASWPDAPDWQKDSARKGVQFCLQNPDAPASANHESWSAEKLRDGWKYGDVKDPEAKTHPCLVPFSALPPEQQVKDMVFKAIVAAHS